MGYSLDNQANITIFGDSVIPLPCNGSHIIQVFGENYNQEICCSSKINFILDNVNFTSVNPPPPPIDPPSPPIDPPSPPIDPLPLPFPSIIISALSALLLWVGIGSLVGIILIQFIKFQNKTKISRQIKYSGKPTPKVNSFNQLEHANTQNIIYCSKCGNQEENNANYCPWCGNRLIK